MDSNPRFLLIFGPPAVGKMSVGRAVAERSTFRLFHNHHTIEPLLEVFGDFESPAFSVLNEEFRRRVVEVSAEHQLDLCFTFVWSLQDPKNTDYIERVMAPYLDQSLYFVELAASLPERLVRNRGESWLEHKRSKRNVEWSDDNVRSLDVHQTQHRSQHPNPGR